MIPLLIIQPFVENAILHGLLPLDKGGMLQLNLVLKDGHIQCCIEDNGIGSQLSARQKIYSPGIHKSHGMETNLKRIELWNKEHEVSRGVEILDKVPAEHG